MPRATSRSGDCRSWEEFTGQRVAAARAGHIPGAVHLDWLELMQRDHGLRLVDDLAGLLEKRGISPEQDVIAHCQTHHRSGLAYMVARLLGYPRIRAYHGSWVRVGQSPGHAGGDRRLKRHPGASFAEALLTAFVGLLAGGRQRHVKRLIVWAYTRVYPVNLSEAEAASADDYETFNAFFTRRLKPGVVRPLPEAADVLLVCPRRRGW